MTNLATSLSSQAGFNNLVQALDSYLKAQKFTELDKYLRSHMAANPSPISQLCLRIPENSAYFEPQSWKSLSHDIVAASQGIDKISAIGFDLTGHWEGQGPGFEVSLYRDKISETFSFSKESHPSLLAKATYPTPWQGCFDDCDSFGPIKGLESLYDALYDALYAYPDRDWYAHERSGETNNTPPPGYIGYFLGLIFLHLRVQETFARELKQYGLPREMPVVLGTHDFMGIFFPGYNVLINTTLSRDIPTYEHIQAEQNLQRREKAKSYAAEQIERFTKNWVTLRHVNHRASKDKNAFITASLNSSMSLTLSLSNITPPKPIQDMDELEFKSLMETFYKARLNRAA